MEDAISESEEAQYCREQQVAFVAMQMAARTPSSFSKADPVGIYAAKYMTAFNQFVHDRLNTLTGVLFGEERAEVASLLGMMFDDELSPSNLLVLIRACRGRWDSQRDLDEHTESINIQRLSHFVDNYREIVTMKQELNVQQRVALVLTRESLQHICSGFGIKISVFSLLIANVILHNCGVLIRATSFVNALGMQDEMVSSASDDMETIVKSLTAELCTCWTDFAILFSEEQINGGIFGATHAVSSENECVICLDSTTELPCDIRALCCNTTFHMRCLGHWLLQGQGQSTCPQCRRFIHFPQRRTPPNTEFDQISEDILIGLLNSVSVEGARSMGGSHSRATTSLFNEFHQNHFSAYMNSDSLIRSHGNVHRGRGINFPLPFVDTPGFNDQESQHLPRPPSDTNSQPRSRVASPVRSQTSSSIPDLITSSDIEDSDEEEEVSRRDHLRQYDNNNNGEEEDGSFSSLPALRSDSSSSISDLSTLISSRSSSSSITSL